MGASGLKSIANALKIGNISNPILISEATATVTDYAFENRDKLLKLNQNESKVVVFIDIGQCKTSIVVAEYKTTPVNEIEQDSDSSEE